MCKTLFSDTLCFDYLVYLLLGFNCSDLSYYFRKLCVCDDLSIKLLLICDKLGKCAGIDINRNCFCTMLFNKAVYLLIELVLQNDLASCDSFLCLFNISEIYDKIRFFWKNQ